MVPIDLSRDPAAPDAPDQPRGAPNARGGASHGVVPRVSRIAVLRANALGDLVMALPAFEALRAAYPAAEITLLGRAQHAALLDGRPGPIDRIAVLPEGAVGDEPHPDPRVDAMAVADELRTRHFDLAVQLHGGGRHSNRLVRSLDARVTAGARTSDAPDLDRWLPYQSYQSEVARCLDVVALVGAHEVGIEPRITPTAADDAAVASELPGLGGRPWAVIHPGATDVRRRWPVDGFATVATALGATGRDVVVTGTGPESELVHEVVEAAGPRGVAALDLSIPALVSVLAGADLVVGNDTGPLHLAAAVAAPTVAIYWIGNLVMAAPFSRLRSRPLVSWRVTCPECGADAVSGPRCPHDPSFVADVPVASVLEAAAGLLAAA